MSVTLKDIAEELNLSATAVSRALRNMPDIGPDTTKLVQETAERLGYRKNLAASYLKTAKSMMFGIIVPDICNPVFSHMYKGIEEKCKKKQYALMLSSSNESSEQETSMIDKMVAHGVDGLFIVPSNESDAYYPQLDNANIPYVILQRTNASKSPFLIKSNDYEGGYMAAEYLYGLGHRSFLLVFADMKISSAKERYNGFKDFLNDKNIPESNIQLLQRCITRSEGYQATKQWLSEQTSIQELSATAIFCFSDYIAYGVYSALSESGLKIPDDISVVGYDNNEYSDIIYPALTTIDLLPYEIGTHSAKLMLNIIHGDSSQSNKYPQQNVLSPKLTIRNSTKALTDHI